MASNSFMENLIGEVRGHPEIYDVRDPEYKNYLKKNRAWTAIASALEVQPEYAKNRWKAVRDHYMRKKKEQKGSTGQAATTTKKMIWEEQLRFLDDTSKQRPSCSNIAPPTPPPTPTIFNCNTGEFANIMDINNRTGNNRNNSIRNNTDRNDTNRINTNRHNNTRTNTYNIPHKSRNIPAPPRRGSRHRQVARIPSVQGENGCNRPPF
ncbi:conserved oligomeric Golgi complex subunit 8-like [Anopheles albimanus]|uniref:conserved oligomeric Golgi complex subunit 8-like n=1 Tax=Anopheles albimanus TaxID=7167 RepID=UPI00164035C3|nr:conserved oligomeric Golgi complex subunit 8-like [Anopheles albimanus]